MVEKVLFVATATEAMAAASGSLSLNAGMERKTKDQSAGLSVNQVASSRMDCAA